MIVMSEKQTVNIKFVPFDGKQLSTGFHVPNECLNIRLRPPLLIDADIAGGDKSSVIAEGYRRR